jgi:hypothetical protein
MDGGVLPECQNGAKVRANAGPTGRQIQREVLVTDREKLNQDKTLSRRTLVQALDHHSAA